MPGHEMQFANVSMLAKEPSTLSSVGLWKHMDWTSFHIFNSRE